MHVCVCVFNNHDNKPYPFPIFQYLRGKENNHVSRRSDSRITRVNAEKNQPIVRVCIPFRVMCIHVSVCTIVHVRGHRDHHMRATHDRCRLKCVHKMYYIQCTDGVYCGKNREDPMFGRTNVYKTYCSVL